MFWKFYNLLIDDKLVVEYVIHNRFPYVKIHEIIYASEQDDSLYRIDIQTEKNYFEDHKLIISSLYP